MKSFSKLKLSCAALVACLFFASACGSPAETLDGGVSVVDSGAGGGAGGGGGGGGGGGAGGGGGDGGVTSDGGSDAGVDGGSDAGLDCATVSLNPVTGSFDLGSGFTVRESAGIPSGLVAAADVYDGGSRYLYGLDGLSGDVRRLGVWPNLFDGGVAFSALSSDAGTGFVSPFLASDGRRLLAGYTKSGGGGHVALFDGLTGGAPSYVLAHGNFTAAGVNNAFAINSSGIDATTGDVALYALRGTAQTHKLATWPTGVSTAQGNTASTNNGILIAGYYDLGDFQNHLLAVPPSAYLGALASGTTVSLTGATEVYAGGDVLGVAGMGPDVIVQRGDYPPPNFEATTSEVRRIRLTLSGSGTQTVSVGVAGPVLTARSTCSKVLFVAPLGPDLIVGFEDRLGARVARITAP